MKSLAQCEDAVSSPTSPMTRACSQTMSTENTCTTPWASMCPDGSPLGASYRQSHEMDAASLRAILTSTSQANCCSYSVEVLRGFYRENHGKLEGVPGKEGLFFGEDGSGRTLYVAEEHANGFMDRPPAKPPTEVEARRNRANAERAKNENAERSHQLRKLVAPRIHDGHVMHKFGADRGQRPRNYTSAASVRSRDVRVGPVELDARGHRAELARALWIVSAGIDRRRAGQLRPAAELDVRECRELELGRGGARAARGGGDRAARPASNMSDRNAVPTNPYHPTCEALRELVDAAADVANRAGELERFASSLRTSVERLASRTADAAVDLEAGLGKMTLLGRRILERDAATSAGALRSVAQTLAAFDVPTLHQALASLAEAAAEIERKLPPHN